MFEKRTDQQIIEAIRLGGLEREGAWRYISENWGGYCCKTAMKSTGCAEHEARQAFSVACLDVDKRIRTAADDIFLKTASLRTYLTSAAIRAAGKIMGQRKKDPSEGRHHSSLGTEDYRYLSRLEDCRETLEKALSILGARCKKILLLFNDDFGMKEIVAAMDLKNEDVAKAEKWKCQEKFKSYLRANPQVITLLRENCYG